MIIQLLLYEVTEPEDYDKNGFMYTEIIVYLQ